MNVQDEENVMMVNANVIVDGRPKIVQLEHVKIHAQDMASAMRLHLPANVL
jgi:hypothetical protein